LKVESLLRFNSAAHFSYLVESPYKQRGGILLVAGPGNLKSTIVEHSLKPYPDALRYSDLTLKQLAVVRSQIYSGVYNTLGFLELEKIYARQMSVAMNFEGVVKAMVEEGFSHFAFEDQRMWVPTVRCFVLASVLDNLYRFHFPRWIENGFIRRFIVFKYTLSRESKIKMKQALHEGELVPFPSSFGFPSTMLKEDVTREESQQLEILLGADDALSTPLNLMRKCLTILKWRDKLDRKRKTKTSFTPLESIQDLKDGIGPSGGILEL
jgi:hypothetical protein